MASKSATADFRSILTKIGNGEYAPVYLLMGEESYYIDQIVAALEERVVPEEERDFNLLTFYGADSDILDVVAACRQYPVMAERKLVMLKEAQSMDQAKRKLENLADYVTHPMEQNILVVVYKDDRLSGTSKLMKAAARSEAVIFDSPKLRDYELAEPIRDYCRSKRIAIQDKALALLVESVGNSLSKLFGEIDKLIVASKGKLSTITADLVAENIGVSKEYNNYELQAALAAKNYDKCLRIVRYFASNPKNNPTPVTAGLLLGFFSKLVLGHMAQDKSDQGLTAAMGVRNSFALREMKSAMRNYSIMQSIAAIHYLREFDAAAKGIDSTQNEHALLLELIYRIFTSRG
ncbi:MAG: DNA polymerase III subunit delta [Bacteroides sp.]|nr:DNA polymerase III subunit delta [Bacteroides sp.]